MAKEQHNISCEVIDLMTILPWDSETIFKVIMIKHYLLFLMELSP